MIMFFTVAAFMLVAAVFAMALLFINAYVQTRNSSDQDGGLK